MDAVGTAKVLAALGHEGRLLIFQLLARAGPGGLPAGEVARRSGQLQNTTSTHLSVLSNAGLVAGRRDGRSIIYAVARPHLRDALAFLTEDLFGAAGNVRAAFLEQLADPAGGADRAAPQDRDDAAA